MASGTKSSPVIGNNCIYIGSDDGTLYCLSLAGKSIWTFNTGNAIESPPLFHDNTVYVGTLEGELFAVDAETGKQRWKYQTEGQISGSPNYFLSGTAKKIIVGSYDYSLHCIDDATGKPEWKYTSDNYINCAPAISGKVTVFGGCDGNLHVVNLVTGKLKYKINMGLILLHPVPYRETRPFLAIMTGQFYCVDYTTKKLVWEQTGRRIFRCIPGRFGNKVVTGSENRIVFCYNKADGKILWKYQNSG